MKTVAIIVQARMGSTRLPGKVLKKIDGKPLLWYLFERIKRAHNANAIILATTTSNQDKVLLEFANEIGILAFTGNEDDVLDRYYHASKKFNVDVIVRVTGDCPLIDPVVVDKGIELFLNNSYDYVSNLHPPTYPDGMDVEIFSFYAIENAWKNATKKSEREHVTPYIWNHPESFTLKNFENQQDWSKYRLTVDEPADFALLTKIILNFKGNWISFSTKDVIAFLNQSKTLLEINAQFERNEGYQKSLNNDSRR